MTETVSTYIQWHAERVREDQGWIVRALATRITVEELREAYEQVRRSGATGVDGVTWDEYGENLISNLEDLHKRLKEQRYRAPPVRRAWIPKDGGRRPLGIPTLEDKVVQRVVKEMLEPIYEVEFKDCSYGFRPGRDAHQAISAIRDSCMEHNIRWIIDADISKCFDTIDHAKLKEVMQKRIQDGSILRLVGKWLNAGVMDGLELSYPEAGTPQGGVISPLLANIYLHYVLDEWFYEQAKPCLKGNVCLVRYADDFVIGFEHEDDARRVMAVLPKRMEAFGLTIHPEKTRLVDFRVPVGAEKGNTFNFLGFTLYWAVSRKGYWVVKKRTISKRKARAIKRNHLWCKLHRHEPIEDQHKKLTQKLRGYYNYFGVIGNYDAIMSVYHWTKLAWKKWLGRRGAKAPLTWAKFNQILVKYPLPMPHICHGV